MSSSAATSPPSAPVPGEAPGPRPPDPPGSADGRPRALAVVLLVVGVAWLLALTGVAVPWSVVLPGGVLAIGIAVLVGGERVTRHGLGGLGIALAAIALLLPAAPSGISPVAGERTVVVTDDTALQAGYGLGMGTMVLDLRAIDLEEAVTAVAATVGLGELTVLVPEGAAVRGTAQVGAGEAVAFGATSAGIGPRRSFDTASDGDEGPVLELTLRVGLGQIEVDR